MQNAKCYTLTRNAKCKVQNVKLRNEVCRAGGGNAKCKMQNAKCRIEGRGVRGYATLCVADMPSSTDDIFASANKS